MAKKANARGTFTVWYIGTRDRSARGDHYEHGITASSRSDLLRKATEKCPADKSIKSITWQHGGSWNVWYRVAHKSTSQCWDVERCKEIFDE